MKHLEEVMKRIGSRPALIHMASVSDHFGDAAPYRIEDGVAIIDICGPLSNAAWSWRGTTYGDIQSQCRIAEADPTVRAVLLNVNSPGGETDNAFETAELIAALKKPVYAVAATMAYSAAYLLASQADKIYCTPTSGGVGSVGVYCAHFDYSEMLKKDGVKVTLISAGEGKTTGSPYLPLSAADEEEIQQDIDWLYGEFVSAVASGRGMREADVVKLGAKLYDGAQRAIASGLADVSGDLTTAWVDLCSEVARIASGSPFMRVKRNSAASAANAKEQQLMKEQTAAEVKTPTAAEIDTMLAQARTDGFTDAAQIVDLCAIAGMPNLAAGFIGEKKSSAEVRKALLDAKAAGQTEELNTTLMPGADAKSAQGNAKPWSEVLTGLGFKKK